MQLNLLCIPVFIFLVSNGYAQQKSTTLQGKYSFFYIKENDKIIFDGDTTQVPANNALTDKIQKSYFEITADSMIVVDGLGARKGWKYKFRKGKNELWVNDKGEKTITTYTLEGNKLHLYLSHNEKHSEVILIKQP